MRSPEHHLRAALKRAIEKRRPTVVEHETGLTMQTIRRFIARDSAPLKRTMATLWTWADRHGDGTAKELARGELRKLGVTPIRRAGAMGSDT